MHGSRPRWLPHAKKLSSSMGSPHERQVGRRMLRLACMSRSSWLSMWWTSRSANTRGPTSLTLPLCRGQTLLFCSKASIKHLWCRFFSRRSQSSLLRLRNLCVHARGGRLAPGRCCTRAVRPPALSGTPRCASACHFGKKPAHMCRIFQG